MEIQFFCGTFNQGLSRTHPTVVGRRSNGVQSAFSIHFFFPSVFSQHLNFKKNFVRTSNLIKKGLRIQIQFRIEIVTRASKIAEEPFVSCKYNNVQPNESFMCTKVWKCETYPIWCRAVNKNQGAYSTINDRVSELFTFAIVLATSQWSTYNPRSKGGKYVAAATILIVFSLII